jgi:ribosomal protein S18 acetylase RimI-like enzyme
MIDSAEDASVLDAMDANMAAFWLAYGRGQGCSLGPVGGTAWFHTGIFHPLFNGVPRPVLDSAGVDAAVDALQARIDANGAPAFWWLGPRAVPRDLGQRLERRGLSLAGQAPGMAVDLSALDGALSDITGFRVARVDGPADQAAWARVAATGTGLPAPAVTALERIEASLNQAAYAAQPRYIGYLEQRPVASAALVLDGGVAGVYAVATLPEARHRGIGRAMTVRPLLDARRDGYRVAVLQASPMGYPIYERLGFRDVCHYALYLQGVSRDVH